MMKALFLSKGRVFSIGMTAVLLLMGFIWQAHAAEWKPTKPITFVVPYAPGGGSDVLGRSIVGVIDSEKLCPVTIMVENKPGGGATIGTTSVAQAKGDTHMLLTFISGQVAGPMVAGKGAATFHDLTLICGLAIDEQLIVVKNDSPLKTVQDIVAMAKQRALTIGGTATGQEDQMCNRLFEKAADIKTRYVPFNSGGECITALLGGHVDMIWANPGEFVPQWEAKNVRPIVVAKETRLAMLPDVPTFKEKGYDVTFKMFRGIAAPPGIPAETAAYYENMMKKMSELPGWKEKYVKNYMLTASWMGNKEFTQFVTQSEQLFKGILTELGLIK
jgi:putative tricarboxylic transport membrane protein